MLTAPMLISKRVSFRGAALPPLQTLDFLGLTGDPDI
jgi:hypothetical protein